MFGLKSTFNRLKQRQLLASTPDVCFLWIPKNAGTAVFRSLNSVISLQRLKRRHEVEVFANRGAVSFGHWSYQSLRESGIVNESYHRRAFKFAICRDPYARAVSLYHYLTWGKNAPKYSIDHFLDDVLLNRAPIGLYHVRHLSQANPQIEWILDDAGKLIPDMIYRFENLRNMQADLSERFGTPIIFDRVNVSTRRKSHVVKPISLEEDILSDEIRMQKIECIYHRDFLKFDYPMKSAAGQSGLKHHFPK